MRLTRLKSCQLFIDTGKAAHFFNSTLSEVMALQVCFDGGARGNPGRAGAGWSVTNSKGEYLAAGIVYVGEKSTNNVAEYHGCIAGLKAAERLKAMSVLLRGDSMLVLNQVVGVWGVNAPHLLPLRDEARELSRAFIGGFETKHLPAHENFMADALSNVAMETKTTREGLELIEEAEKWMKDNVDKVKKGPRSRKRKSGSDKSVHDSGAAKE